MLGEGREEDDFKELRSIEEEHLGALALCNAPPALLAVPDVADEKLVQVDDERIRPRVLRIDERSGEELLKGRLLKAREKGPYPLPSA